MSRHAASAPATKRGIPPVLTFLIVIVVLALVAFGGIALVKSFTGSKEAGDYPGPGSGTAAVVVADGDSASAIAQTLAKADVVKSAGAFVTAASADDRSRGIAPGTYKLKKQMSAAGALALMLDPSSRVDVVTIPEGTRINDTLALIAKNTRLKLPALKAASKDLEALDLPWPSASTAEGFLFPAQYDVKPNETAAQFLKTMVDRYKATATRVDMDKRSEALGQSTYDVLIVASIIQDEVAPADYAKAARVIYNRLDKPMRLQLDSTLNYGLGRKTVSVSIADTRIPGPYNTYLNEGLPPTPINSPGEAAIEAALNPAKGDWLYWVTTDLATQTTKFATTYQQFLQYKAEFDASQK